MFARHDRFAVGDAGGGARGGGSRCWRPIRGSIASVLTTVVMPEGHDADALRGVILEHFDMSLGAGAGEVEGARCSGSGTWGISMI